MAAVWLITQVYQNLLEAYQKKKYSAYVLEGGSRSSKTHSIIQFWIFWAFHNRGGRVRRVIVCRLKATWVKPTVLKDFIDVLTMYDLYDRKAHNKSEGAGIIRLFDTEFWFMGLDDAQRIHGMKSDAFWMNEAIEANFEDYAQLMQRCEGFAILDYNPSEEEHWIYTKLSNLPTSYYSHSTMLDNRLISANAKAQILSYEPTEKNFEQGTADKRKWEIYGLGRRAKIEGLVFDGFTLIDVIPSYVKKLVAGIDFGYSNDVTACGDVGIHENTLFINELFYATHMLGTDIIHQMKNHNMTTRIWAESADPRLIDEIYNAGFNIRAVKKGAGSINAGIDKMKSMKLVITNTSVNTIKEFKNYTYQQDRQGKWLNKPVEVNNHSIDFIRYVVLMELLGKRAPSRHIRQFFK